MSLPRSEGQLKQRMMHGQHTFPFRRSSEIARERLRDRSSNPVEIGIKLRLVILTALPRTCDSKSGA